MKRHLITALILTLMISMFVPFGLKAEAKAPTKTQFSKEIQQTIRTAEKNTWKVFSQSEPVFGKPKPFSKLEPTIKKYYTPKYIKKWKAVYNKVGANFYVLNEPFYPFMDHESGYQHLKNAKVSYSSAFRVKTLSSTKATVEFDIPPAEAVGDKIDSYIAQYKLLKKNGKWLLDEKTWKHQKPSKFRKYVTDKNVNKIVLKQIDTKGAEVKSSYYHKGAYHVKIGQKGMSYGWYFEEVSPYTGAILLGDY